MRLARTCQGAKHYLRHNATAAVLLTTLSACDNLLKVSTPGSLQEGQLANPGLEQLVVNGAIGEFQFAYGNYALWSGVLADETFADHTDVGIREFSLHAFNDLNTTNEAIYANLQRARQSAEDATDRLREMLGAKAATSLNVARTLIYAGYSYVLLGEGFCDAPVRLSAPLSTDELLTRAIARFDEGIAIATAAPTGADTAAQSLIALARVGAARASLKKGDALKARTYAEAVPNTYERWAYYSANSQRENNALWIGVKVQGTFIGIHPRFQGLGDARLPQPAATVLSIAKNAIYSPLRPSMYAGWTETGPPQTIDLGTHIRFASGLEARYISVEVDGPTSGMITFVNARRAIARKPPVNVAGSALLAEFRMQRAIDFYLTGQRLGDLRRYVKAGVDSFPEGRFPVSQDRYGAMHCFIVPHSEKVGNPNY